MRLLYHLPLSPYSRKVRLVLAEKRLPFELRVEKVWQRRPEYLEMNPACTVPTLVEENGFAVPDSGVICEYLEEAYPETPADGPHGRAAGRGAAAGRLVRRQVRRRGDAQPAGREVHEARCSRRGNPDATALRAGYGNMRHHLEYLGWLAETRRWLAGEELSLADFAAAGHLSALDFASDVDWTMSPAAREWYARMKSRPSFRSLLADQVPGVTPPAHYADLDF